MDNQAELTIAQALVYLRAKHGIKLGSGGLRSHIAAEDKKVAIEPILNGKFNITPVMPTGYWTVTLADLDAWAAQYTEASKSFKYLGHANRGAIKEVK